MTDYSELLKRADEATGLGWYIDPTPYAAALREQAGEIERLTKAVKYADDSKQAGIEAAVFDAMNGTPCEQIRWQQERDTLVSENAGLRKDAERYREARSGGVLSFIDEQLIDAAMSKP